VKPKVSPDTPILSVLSAAKAGVIAHLGPNGDELQAQRQRSCCCEPWNDVLLVQCRSNRWRSAAEVAAMRRFPCPPNCRKLVHRWRDRRTQPDMREVR
jgi:hypothetical protein